MAIPTRAIACQASRTNLVGPIIEFVKDKVDEIRNEIEAVAESAEGRRDPTHVGFGVRFDLDLSSENQPGGFASDISCRIDLLSIDINDGDDITCPEHPTPAVSIDMDLRKINSNGSQDYLLGGPLEPTRLKSIGASIAWNQENWAASATLNDAAFAGIVDWDSSIPGQLMIDEFTTDAGFSECVNTFLTNYAMVPKPPGGIVDNFMMGLQVLGLAEQNPITFDPLTFPTNLEISSAQDDVWQISAVNLDLLVNSPLSYLESLFLDAYGNWDFNQFLSSAGNTLFDYLSTRIDLANIINEIGSSFNGWLKISLPSPSNPPSLPAWVSNFPISINISPNGIIMLELDEFSLGGIALNADISIDLSNQIAAINLDDIIQNGSSIPSPPPLNFIANLSLGFANNGFGPFSGAQLLVSFDRSAANLTGIPFSVDFNLPNLKSILDISILSSGSSLTPQWESFINGLSLPIYPLPADLSDPASFVRQLAKIAPSLIIESIVQFAIDEFVLSNLPTSSLMGELLEFLQLAQETESGSGNYRCNSFLSLISDPLQHLEDIFFENDVINVSAVLSFASILLDCVDLPVMRTFFPLPNGSPSLDLSDISKLEFDLNFPVDPVEKISSYFQNGAPVGLNSSNIDDLWVDTENGDVLYKWDGGNWIICADSPLSTAIHFALSALSITNGMINTFFQFTQPVAENIGDIWININESNKAYIWDGSTWGVAEETAAKAISNAAGIVLPQPQSFAKFFVSCDSKSSTFVTFGICSTGSSGLVVRNPKGEEIVNLDFNIQVSIASDYSLSPNGSSFSATFYPYEILDGLGLSTSAPPPFSLSLNPNSYFQVDASLGTSGFALSFSLSMDGSTNQGDFATLSILPQFSGLDSLLNLILGQSLSAILPKILDRAVEEMNSFTFTSTNRTQTSVGEIFSALANAVGLLESVVTNGVTSLKFSSSELALLMSDPRGWLMGTGTFLSGKLDELLVSGLEQIVELAFDSTSIPGLNAAWVSNSPSDEYLAISFEFPFPALLHEIAFNFGRIGGDISLNASFSPTIDLPGSPSIGLVIDVSGGISFSNSCFHPEFNFSLGPSTAILATPLEIWPEISCGYSAGDFTLTLTSNSNDDNLAFWINILPLPNGPLVKDTDYGIPDLTDLLLGVADQALEFIAGVDAIQTWLAAPLYTPAPGAPDFSTTLSDISIPGDLLVAFQIMSSAGPTPPYSFNAIKSIIDAYLNPLEVIIGGLMGMLETAINGATSSGKPGITLFEKEGGDFDFRISLVDADPGSNARWGINFTFEELDLEIGNLVLKLFFQEQDVLDAWTSSRPEFMRGITLYLVEWKGGTDVSPHISLEIGGFGVELGRKGNEPLLDKFILLNTVGFATALDFNIFGTGASPNIEFGGQLILDDFGVSLGGNGESDGGNGMAAGVLAGGDGDQEAIRPIFDIALSKYHHQPLDVSMVGASEFWFPINKQFGPIKIAQIGVRYEEETPGDGNSYTTSDADAPFLHRLSILIDGEAEIAGFLAQVDDLEVNMPLLRLMEFDEWRFDMAGMAISYTNPGLEIAGALRKAVVTDSQGNNPYVEYQGLCTVNAGTFALSAMGAFGRVPSGTGDNTYVSCFVIAALDTPLGGPPFFFVTGLMGGLGLNRQLLLPDVTAVPSSPFMTIMDGFGSDPMGALKGIQSTMPAEYGSLWFAVGLKFTTFQIVESKAVLFIKIDEGFTVGILGMSSLSLPSKEFNVGYVELAFLAYYNSTENILWVEAQLTDASYLFSKSCRLTGGFALVNWFNTGEFLLSLGGYHPKFKAPSYYPYVPRLGFNWQPINKLTIKGEAYFTICSSAVMLGGGFSASYKSGSLSASFRMGVDVLVVFDPFYYNFSCYIGVSLRFKTWLGTVKGSVGADLEIEGPKMRGKARIEISFIEFTVKFGSTSSPGSSKISALEFINKHLRQLPEGSHTQALDAAWKGGIVNGKKTSGEWLNVQVEKGALSPSEAGVVGEQPPDEEEMPSGLTANDPWLFTPEFSISYNHLMPATSCSLVVETESETNLPIADSKPKSVDPMQLSPCFIDENIIVPVSIKISPSNNSDGAVQESEGLSFTSSTGYFADTLWECDLDSDNRPKAKKSAGAQRLFFTGGKIVAKSRYEDASPIIDLNKIEECNMIHNLPLLPYRQGTTRPSVGGAKTSAVNLASKGSSLDRLTLQDGTTVKHNSKPSLNVLGDIFSSLKQKNGSRNAKPSSIFSSNEYLVESSKSKIGSLRKAGGGNK